MPLLLGGRASAGGGNIPALSAASRLFDVVDRSAVRGLTCEVKAIHKSGSPAARANHGQSPEARSDSGGGNRPASRTGHFDQSSCRSQVAPRGGLAVDLLAPIPPKHGLPVRKGKRNAAQAAEYSIAIDLPELCRITEVEIRALRVVAPFILEDDCRPRPLQRANC